MKRVFADSFYYFALLNPDDQAHRRSVQLNQSLAGRMVTTRWVLTELGDGLSRGPARSAFTRTVSFLESDPEVDIVECSEELWRDGVKRYAARPDKEWSLTDCISFIVMEREGLREALTGDHHFEQAGFMRF